MVDCKAESEKLATLLIELARDTTVEIVRTLAQAGCAFDLARLPPEEFHSVCDALAELIGHSNNTAMVELHRMMARLRCSEETYN